MLLLMNYWALTLVATVPAAQTADQVTPARFSAHRYRAADGTEVQAQRGRLRVPLRRDKPGQTIEHTLQTNGTKLDEEWAAFFAEHGFLIGLSMDGPEDIHDAQRVDKGGKGTHAQVMRAARLLPEARNESVELRRWRAVSIAHKQHTPQPVPLLQRLRRVVHERRAASGAREPSPSCAVVQVPQVCGRQLQQPAAYCGLVRSRVASEHDVSAGLRCLQATESRPLKPTLDWRVG